MSKCFIAKVFIVIRDANSFKFPLKIVCALYVCLVAYALFSNLDMMMIHEVFFHFLGTIYVFRITNNSLVRLSPLQRKKNSPMKNKFSIFQFYYFSLWKEHQILSNVKTSIINIWFSHQHSKIYQTQQ